jgi:hypothetical protein
VALVPAAVAVELGASFSGLSGELIALGEVLSSELAGIGEGLAAVQLELDGRLAAMDAKLDDILEAVAAITAGGPLWPGRANVDLGEPVALTPTLTIEAAMDGVVIELKSVPTAIGRVVSGDFKFYWHVGWLCFLTAEGQAEPSQWLAMNSSIYTCKMMTQAAGIVLYCRGGVEGTVTPWTIKA